MFARSAFAAVVSLTVLGLGSVRSAPPESVWTDGDTAYVAIRYGDLDLASPSGAEAMLRRIRRAAVRICGPEPADRLSFQRQYETCLRQTVDRALDGLAASTVGAAYSSTAAPSAASPQRELTRQ